MATELTPEEYERAVQLAVVVAENGCVLIEARRAADIFANALILAHAQRRTEGTREICLLCDGSEGPDGEWWRDCNNEYCPLRKGTP